jgi:hypothetical protein
MKSKLVIDMVDNTTNIISEKLPSDTMKKSFTFDFSFWSFD